LSIFEAIVAILLVKKEEMWKKHPFYRATVFFLLMVGAVLLFVIGCSFIRNNYIRIFTKRRKN
jgi:hypothetical protein